jgi:hypothetical protein
MSLLGATSRTTWPPTNREGSLPSTLVALEFVEAALLPSTDTGGSEGATIPSRETSHCRIPAALHIDHLHNHFVKLIIHRKALYLIARSPMGSAAALLNP